MRVPSLVARPSAAQTPSSALVPSPQTPAMASLARAAGPAGVLRLQRAVGNAVVAGLVGRGTGPGIQRKISHDGSRFETDGTRPGWRSGLKKSVVNEYNDLYGTSLGPRSQMPDTDRAHRLPFAAIEELVCDYCNGDADTSELKELTNALYPDGEWDSAAEGMFDARVDLIDEVNAMNPSPSKIVKAANTLLSHLNSSAFNVSPGDFSTNRSIQDHFDPGLTWTPQGVNVEFTPRSQQIYDAWDSYGRAPDPKYSPGGSTMSSHHHSFQ